MLCHSKCPCSTTSPSEGLVVGSHDSDDGGVIDKHHQGSDCRKVRWFYSTFLRKPLTASASFGELSICAFCCIALDIFCIYVTEVGTIIRGRVESSNQFDNYDIYSRQSSHLVTYWDNVMSFQMPVQHYIAKWRSCCWEPWLWWWRCYRQASSGLRL